jgi:histone deacetylase complex regulatory component SIN3
MPRKRKQPQDKLPELIQETVVTDLDDFWDLLSPEKVTANLLYRGQSRASWKLQPSILRFHESSMPANDFLAQVSERFREAPQLFRWFGERA